MSEEIIIEFDENGNPVMEAKGFKGDACMKHLEALANIIGRTTDVKDKPEKRLQNRSFDRQKARNG